MSPNPIDLDDLEQLAHSTHSSSVVHIANFELLALIKAVRCAQKYVGPHWSTYGELESPLHELKESLQPFRAEVKG